MYKYDTADTTHTQSDAFGLLVMSWTC